MHPRLARVSTALVAWSLACACVEKKAQKTRPPAPMAARDVTPAPPEPLPKKAPAAKLSPEERLLRAFQECDKHDLGALDGRWKLVGEKAADVWLCAGHIRWQDGPVLADICFSALEPTKDGFDAEGFHHEDWHDPGDAQGYDFQLRQQGERLTVRGTDWTDGSSYDFLTLTRNPSPGDRPAMKCPIE